MELKTDILREYDRTGDITPEATGIYVRAKSAKLGKWINADVAELDRESLITWCESRPNGYRAVLLALFGHAPDNT